MSEAFAFNTPPDDPSKLNEAFGFGADLGQPQTIQNALDHSQAVADMLIGNANSQLTTQLASSAAFADQMTGPVVQSIQGTLGDAAQTLGQLQSPIEQGIVTQLSSVGGNAVQLGVNLPTANQPTSDPLCVLIANEASHGIIDTALRYARGNILPYANPKTAQYFQQYNYVEGCMAAYPAAWQQFASALAVMERDASISVPAGVGNSTVSALVDSSNVQSGSGSAVQTPYSNYPAPTGTFSSQNVLTITDNPLLTGSGAPPVTGNIGLGPTPISYGNIPTTTVGSGAPPVYTAPIGSVIAGSGAPPVAPSLPSQPTPGVIQTPNADGTSTCRNAYGYEWTIPAGATCGSGPPPGYPSPTQPYVPEYPTTPPTQLPTTPPTVPPPTAPPQQPCIKICKEEPTQCTDKKYCVWQNVETKVCYVTADDAKPQFSSDRKIVCGVPTDSWVNAICNACNRKSDEQPEQPPTYGGLPSVNQQNGCGNLFRFQSLATPLNGQFFTQLIANIINSIPPFKGSGLAIADWVANAFVKGSGEIGGAFFDALSQAMNIPLFNCSGSDAETGIIAARILTGLAQRWLSGAAEPADTSLSYAQNTLCPYKIPSPGEATSSWLGNNIDLDRLRCIVEANGNRWDSWYPIADAARTKLSVGEYATLFRRKVLQDAEYQQKLRECGVTRDDDKFLAYQLTQFIAPPSDIVSMMIRDAADTKNIDWTNSDAIFVDKYTGPLRTWGEQQGLDDEYMKMLWRAHWSLPSPGQLYVMLHRLSRLPPNDPAYVDLPRIRQTLLQQDIHPDWVDSFIAISYSPLTRIDARRAYEIGALDQNGLKEAYLNLGYDPGTADTLVNFNVLNSQRTILRNPSIRQYADGQLTAAEMYDLLRQGGARDADLPAALDRGAVLLRVSRRKRCIAAIRKRYLLAEITRVDAETMLQQQGLDQTQVTEIAAGMECERSARGKVLTGQQILGLYRDGIIFASDAFDRLMTIGYDEDEASLLVRQMAQRIQIKIQQDELRQLKQQQRDAQKLKNAIDKANKQQQTLAKQQAANAERARKVKEMREKRLLEAAKLVSEHTGMSFSDAVYFVKNLHTVNITTTAASPDESINAIGVAASDTQLTNTIDITTAVATAISALT